MYYTGKKLFEYLCGVYYTGKRAAGVGWAQKQRFFKKCQRKIQIYYDYEDKLGTVS